MSTNATTTLTVWSADRVALEAYRARVVGPSVPFSLEAAVPTGLDLDAWDHDRATALWGCGRPELPGGELVDHGDRLVDWDGDWDLPADWSFDVARARALAG